jgi:electron transfer flavoprotein alpha subunit
MTTVLVFVEREDGALTKGSLEALTLARGLAEAEGATLEAATVGAVEEAVAGQLGTYGVGTAHAVLHDLLDDYSPDAYAEGLVQLVAARDPRAVVSPGSDRGAEVMAHVAARADLPLAANCTAVTSTDGAWELTRVRWGGVLLEDARLEAARGLFTVAPHQVAAAPAADGGSAAVETFAPDLDEAVTVTRVRDREKEAEGVSLATASVVVSGGRGVGSAEGFAVLEELAELLGGAVGCSRVATNNGWRSHNDQVGQTGTRVAPDLYIACGISGATQHWVGCMSSKRILAINTDPEAPMVTRAHYAVLGDLHEFLPALVEEVKRKKGVA